MSHSAPRLVLSPSDLLSSPSLPRSRVSVGGRIVVQQGAPVLLTDATTLMEVDLDPSLDFENHDLVVLEGDFDGRRLTSATVHERQRPSARAKTTETARFRDDGVGQALVSRAKIVTAIRQWFDREGFLEVETPCAVPSPGLDLHLDAFGVERAREPRYLITSPEYQMKRLLAGGIPRCFQLARCFRRGELGSRHNPEFTMLEWYRTFADADAVIADTEAIIACAATAVGRPDSIEIGGVRVELARPFRRLTVAEAFREWAGVDEETMLGWAAHDEERFFRVLIDEVEPALARQTAPLVLHRYPAQMASLARLAPDDPRYAERFEIYVGGMELSNGFAELTDPLEQRSRLERDQRDREAAGLEVYPVDEKLIAALEEGMPRASGNALGLDRLVALVTRRSDIRSVLAFPEGHL